MSLLDSCPSAATRAFSVLYFSYAFAVHHYPRALPSGCTSEGIQRSILLLHEFIFSFTCDDIQRSTQTSFMFYSAIHPESRCGTLLFDFLTDPQRSQHHTVDKKMQSSITEHCFSYILNHRIVRFPGIRRWANKSTHRPWLCRRRKSKGVLSNINNQFRWQQREDVACNKKLIPFWALLLALKYLPYLLNKATRSEELITLAKMWSYRSFPPSLLSHDAKKVGKAVRHYLARFDRKRKCESVAVGPSLLCIVYNQNELRFADRNEFLACLIPPFPAPKFQPVQIARERSS